MEETVDSSQDFPYGPWRFPFHRSRLPERGSPPSQVISWFCPPTSSFSFSPPDELEAIVTFPTFVVDL